MSIIKIGVRIVSLCAGLAIAGTAWAADTYPDHRIRMIVPFAAGGPTDVIGRLVAERLSDVLGQQVYVENLPGAGGNLGVETAKRAAPDGYTIVAVSTGFIINPSMYTTIGYDPLKDFAPISLVAASPNVITVHPSVAAKNLKELIDLIKANPDKMSYAQPSTGSTPHLVAEQMKQAYGLDMVMVPFNGAPLAINSTLGNHTPMAFTALPPAIGAIKDGSLRGIAILSQAARRGAAGSADQRRTRRAGPRKRHPDRHPGAGRHAAADHRQMARRHRQDGGRPRSEEETRHAGLRPRRQYASRIHRTHQDRSGALVQGGEGGRDTYGLMTSSCASPTSEKPRSR